MPPREVEQGERDLEDPQEGVHRSLLVFSFVGVDWIDTLGPEPAELIQPVINHLEWLWLQAIETVVF